MRLARMPTGTGLAPLANIPDRQCRDGPPRLVIGRKEAWQPHEGTDRFTLSICTNCQLEVTLEAKTLAGRVGEGDPARRRAW